MLAAQVPVPRTVAPSSIDTVAPVSQNTEKLGVALAVILSVLEVPVSEAVVKSGTPGVGTVVSIVTDKMELMALIFPAGSVCLEVIERAPLESVADVIVTVPATQTPVPRTIVLSSIDTVSPVWQDTVKLGVLSKVKLSVLEAPVSAADVKSGAPGTPEAVVSIVTVKMELSMLTFPAVSAWVAVTLCAPEVKVVAVIETGEDAQVAEPTIVTPSFSLTALLGTQDMLNVGVLSKVILSVLEAPVSEATAKSGDPGAAGAVVSIVTDNAVLAVLTFPATSVCLDVIG